MFVTFEEYFGVDDDKLNERFYGFEEYVMEKDLNDEKCYATFKILHSLVSSLLQNASSRWLQKARLYSI